MKELLAGLNQVRGVIGAVLIDATGGVVGSSLPGHIKANNLADIGMVVREVGDTASALNPTIPVIELVAEFQQGMVVIREIDGLFAVVLAVAGANVSTIGVGLNSLIQKLKRTDVGAAVSAPVAAPVAAQQPAAPPPVAAGFRSGPATMPAAGSNLGAGARPVVDRRQSGDILGVLGFGEYRGSVPPDAVGRGFVKHLAKVCEDFFGPDANQILRAEFIKLGVVPDTLTVLAVTDLLDSLSIRIADKKQRQEFKFRVLGDR
jgi:predicted regulator of Ras-like GTPase activity (Roadblock/LC7/MglB family)